MSRSNNPAAQRGGPQMPHWPRAEGEADPSLDPAAHWQQAGQPAPGYPASAPGQVQGYGQPHAQQGYAPQQDPYAQRAAYAADPQPAPARGNFAPHFERFAPPAQTAPAPAPYHPDDQTLAGYAPHQMQQGHYGHDPRYAEPGAAAHQQNWDLANYQAGQMRGHAAPAQPMEPSWQQGQGYAPPDAQWQNQQHQQSWQQGAPAHDPAFDLGGQAHYQQDQYQQPGYDPATDPNAGYAQDDAEDGEPERRGPRALVVVGALVGAIVLGGGLAYGYKMLGGGRDAGKPPVVKADTNPAKTKPANPGGKDVAHTDKKFLNKLGEDKGAPAAATAPVTVAPPVPAPAASDADGGGRKVTTLIVNRDGTIAPQINAAPSAPAPQVPGMVVEGLTTPPRPPLRGAAGDTQAMPPSVQPKVVAGASVQPKVVTAPPPQKIAEITPPKIRADAPAPAADAAKSDAAAAAVAVKKKKPAVRDDAVALGASGTAAAGNTPAPAAASGANGFVAVLASKKSREEALKSFADMHQKYPSQLQGRTPDVREVNLGEKGVWYRLVVGPPGSKEAAGDVCAKLKAGGFAGCWAAAY